MSRRTFASIAAVVSLANAIPVLIAPEALASLYGAALDRLGAVVAQLLAGSYISFALVNWTTRDTTDLAVRQGINTGNFLGWAISAVLWIYAASSGLMNAFGWFGVALTVIFTVGWAYFVLVDRRSGANVVTAAEPR
jgi:hypothetical protein